MRQILVNVVLLVVMLTIGKVSSDAGYWVNLAVLVIGGAVGAAVFTIAERRTRRSITAKLRAHQAVEKRNAARIAQFVESQRARDAVR